MLANFLGSGGANGGFSPLYQIGGPRSIQLVLQLQFDVRDAFRQLELRHTRGKLVPRPWTNEASFVTWVRLR
jgi:hypothetical protein